MAGRGRRRHGPGADVTVGAAPAELLAGRFPAIELPVRPGLPPMEAATVDAIPTGEGWLYEPKWDGFRCLAFRRGDAVALQSKALQPLGRYFPELVEAFRALAADPLVLDGEIVVAVEGRLDFDALLQRIHPAERRIRKLAVETPAAFLAFDLLVDERGRSLVDEPLVRRRAALEALFVRLSAGSEVRLSPASRDVSGAREWMRGLGGGDLDGVVAKRLDEPYRAGDRGAMVKVKRLRTADCVVGGFRYTQAGGAIGSLLLGLYDDDGLLHHVGFSSSFTGAERRDLRAVLEPLVEAPGFTGNAPGGPTRWSTERSTEWQPLRPTLVCEIRYDHFSGDRFRHGTKFLRWRPDKAPRECTFAQVRSSRRSA